MRNLIVFLLALTACHGTREPPTPALKPGPELPVLKQDVQQEIDTDIRRYVKRLESKNAAVCLDAVEYLPYFGQAAVPALLEELKSENPNGRALAAAALRASRTGGRSPN